MSINTSRVTVGVAATLLAAKSPSYNRTVSVVIKNTGTQSVFVGGAGVTTANGLEVEVGSILTLDLDENDELYGVVAATTNVISILTQGDE